MKIAIIHGYFLNGTGSNLYVQNLCRQFCKMGHEVLLFCQEQSAEKYDFIESAYLFTEGNEKLKQIHGKATPYEGKCNCYIPYIGRILPVYVKDRYEGFDAEEIPQLSEKDLENYISCNEKALKSTFADHKPDIIISNHTVMQPVYVKRALEDFTDVFIFTVVHGSCLNFSVKKSALALRYAIEGLNVTDKLVFLTDYSMQEFTDFFQGRAEFKAEKILIPAGVDIESFIPLEKGTSKNARIDMLLKKVESEYGNSMEAKSAYGNIMGEGDNKSIDSDIKNKLLHIDWEKDTILLYYGKYLWTKGIHNLILSLPFILQENPDTKLVLVGFGTSRRYLEAIVGAMETGNSKKLKHLLTCPQDFQSHVEPGTEIYSGYILNILEDIDLSKAYFEKTIGIISDKVVFTGFMDHNLLKDLISCADIAIAPSIFPEAFGLVGVEALACGVFPLQPYHSGFKSVVDSYSGLSDLDDNFNALGKLWLDEDLVKNIAIQINTILETYLLRGPDLNEKVKSTARKICIDNYSWDSVALKFLSTFRQSVDDPYS
ncbi:MAG: glycosyltransferase family 4 protein [Peptostreptococcaceae bacterium]|nr:glycosyltransferase family 4 protein [Peptostreptococcaceae bacterium]